MNRVLLVCGLPRCGSSLVMKMLEKERTSDQIGEFVSNDDLATLFDRNREADFQLQMAAIEISLK